MSRLVLTIGPAHTPSARQPRRCPRAAWAPPSSSTGRGRTRPPHRARRLDSLGAGEDPGRETARSHTTAAVVYARPGRTLQQAASAMTRGGCRHLVVLRGGEPAGVVCVRDIVRVRCGEREEVSAQARRP